VSSIVLKLLPDILCSRTCRPLPKGSKGKIRNVISALYSHASGGNGMQLSPQQSALSDRISPDLKKLFF
jgi:hypothetical protein